jgi:predicted DNA-binding protein with PD1-like motif
VGPTARPKKKKKKKKKNTWAGRPWDSRARCPFYEKRRTARHGRPATGKDVVAALGRASHGTQDLWKGNTMNIMQYKGQAETVIIGFGPGEMLLESIRAACAKAKIVNGVVVSGVGTLKTCRMHYIKHTDFPPQDVFFTVKKPLELVSVSGIIADGEPHLHIVISCADKEVWAGHLEDGSEIAYLAEIAILKSNGLRLERHLDEKRRIKLIGPKKKRPATRKTR